MPMDKPQDGETPSEPRRPWTTPELRVLEIWSETGPTSQTPAGDNQTYHQS